MAATENFLEPEWTNPLDESLDAMRDNCNFLLTMALSGADFAPGWRTVFNTTNYAEPTQIVHTKGTRKVTINLTWA